MITIDNKNYILDKYYNEHDKPTSIAKELNVNPSYITKIIKNDTRYIQEKEYRAEISREHRKIAKRDWIRDKVNLINNYMNLLNSNILKQVKNYLILMK